MRYLYFSILILFGCSSTKTDSIRKATVIAASFSITTPFSLNCELFETNLNEDKQTKEVEGGDLQQLSELISKSEKATETSIDVRGELFITYQDNKKERLCFNKFGIFYDGKRYLKNERLLRFLLEEKLAVG